MNGLYTDDVLDLAKEVVTAEEIKDTEIAETVDGMSDEGLAVARVPITSAKGATHKIQTYADRALASKVKDNGTFKMNGSVFHVTNAYKYKTQDLHTFVKWLTRGDEEQIADILAILGGSFVPKLRGLDAVAAKRGMRPAAARDTFLEKVYDEKPKLIVINTDSASAPKWAEQMEDGDRLDPIE
ncbi:MAG: hypothetical protein CMQ02_10255 [Gammaproteobacteria bacterium]|nr:hypothetical protein [Gammaproteobacteria bacterium]BAR30944.1 hypothetical protein [uncultured Mediterranean phage uvMED]